MTQQQKSSISQKVLDAIKSQPGLKARELSLLLGVDKKVINSALYGSSKDKYWQDDKYGWYLSKDAPASAKTKGTQVPNTVLSRIAQYYLACLGQNDEGGVSVFANGKFELDYCELQCIPQIGSEATFESKNIQDLIGKIRKDRGRFEMYFGYPTTLRKCRSQKTNWEGMFVEPILLYPVTFDEGTPKISQGFPIFNMAVIKRFTNADRDQIMNELVQLEDELGFNSKDEMPEMDDLVRKLKKIRPEWPWEEAINPDKLSTGSALKETQVEGIYNRAVFVIGERSPFTQGLESELKTLSEMESESYEDTALGRWINGNVSKTGSKKEASLLEVLPMNSEQRQAIYNSLNNSLTIITGPPGTGKSQVVTNLIINATWQGKKVLFASKNNKAVDVVEIRVNNLGIRPMLLRTGSGEYNTKLAEYLMGLLTATSNENDQEEFDIDMQRYKNLESKFLQIEAEESELIRLRNETDELDQLVEKIRRDVSPQVFDYLKIIKKNSFQSNYDSFEDALGRADRDSQGFIVNLFWKLMKKKRYQQLQLEIKDIKLISSSLGLDFPPEDCNDNTIGEWLKFSKILKNYQYLIDTVQNYFLSLKSLQKTKDLEIISREKISLLQDMASNAEDLWSGWLKLQPSRLSKEDRTLLGNYNALLKMVIDAGGDAYTKLGRKIYREYSNLSKKVSHLLPAWATTSLSARGKIPFEANYFDLVIFDEASQCDIASALPLLYRAKNAVIIGDPKQLKHISGLQRGQDQLLLGKYDLIPEYAKWAFSLNSLFDLASGLISSNDIISLRDHHRSHSDIIEFSNKEFYEGKLRVATNYSNLKLLDSEKNGVRWINVVGSARKPATGGAINEIEAKAVVKEIEKLVYKKQYTGSIGVVTPFRAQANYIAEIINSDNDLQGKLMNHDFLVDTVHKFQGDERDLMIFSPVVSAGMPNGALSFMKNNGNLFNVAVTRARALLLVIGDQNAIIDCKVSYLENFAKYTQQLECDSKLKATESVECLSDQYPVVSHPERVSEWEHTLYKELYKAGVKAIPQFQVEKYTLDFALIKDGRRLDIEVDGERYHKNWTGELCKRDQIRNQRLFELGWDVKRFWVYEVRDDISGCVDKVKQWMKSEN